MEKNDKKITALCVGGLFTLGGMSAATQILAQKLEYHPLLGASLFHLDKTPVYMPYDYLLWAYQFKDVIPIPISEAFPYLGVPLFIGGVAAGALTIKEKKLTTHGSASWGDYPNDFYSAGVIGTPSFRHRITGNLPEPKGIFIGRTDDGTYVTDNSNMHFLLVAPTRSGKGVSTVIPTALTWEESMIVNDLKGEIWRKTAWTRKKMGHTVIQFNPSCKDGSATPKNFLDEIRIRTSDEKRDVANIAEIITDPTGDKKKADFWDSTAKEFIIATILHLKYIMPNPSLTDVSIFMRDTSAPLEERLAEALTYPHDPSGELLNQIYGEDTITHPEVARGFNSFLNCPDETRGGILKSAETFLDLFTDPLIRRNTSTSGFMIDDLVFHDKPVSLYITIPADDLVRLKPLLRLMIVQIIGRLTYPEKLEDDDLIDPNDTKKKHKLLMMLDEFVNLGKLGIVESALTYMAGFGLKGMLIVQDFEQLKNVYGQHSQIASGCHTRIFHAPNELVTGKYISDELGTETIMTKTVQYTGIKLLAKRSITESHTGRQLLMPSETLQLSEDKQIVFVTRNKPMMINKIYYYKDDTFLRRMGTREQRLAVKSDYIHHDKDVI